jgi:hypothetical protein
MGLVCLIVCDEEISRMRRFRPEVGCCTTEKKIGAFLSVFIIDLNVRHERKKSRMVTTERLFYRSGRWM